MLSEHLLAHWSRIGYKPDSEYLNEVDEEHDLEIQVGQHKKETNVQIGFTFENIYFIL